ARGVPPASQATATQSDLRRGPWGSRPIPRAAATEQGDSHTVLVRFATTGSQPSHTSTGNVISDPPPATELTAPASDDAPRSTTASVIVVTAAERGRAA